MATSFAESLGRFTRSPGFKFFLVAGLVLLLSIPLALVWFLVTEREGRFHGVKTELAQLFGAEQSLTGPFLIVPYSVKVTRVLNDKSIEDTEERYAVFLPDEFKVDGSANTEIRHRSIYDVTLYTAKLKLSGRFPAPDMRLVDPEAVNIRWRDAILSLALSDVSGLKEAATLTLDGNRTVAFEPSVGLPNNSTAGLNVRLFPIDTATDQPPAAFTFATDIVFNGSSLLSIAPIGRETQIVLASDWPHPSFTGAFLPETRDIRNDGFTASWRIPHLARSVPQAWRVSASQSSGIHQAMWQSLSGVNFYVPIDYYDLVNRAAKYGLLFLAVGFFGVLVLELTSGRRFHAVQYVFVGLAMILFYVLLLGLSEHIGFTRAYLVASGATGGMVSLYVGKSLQNALKGFMMLSIFLILYGLLYLILRLEDYALLAGAVASFLMLTVVMFATLRVNWSGEGGAIGARQLAE